jgi:hypothetical protein
LADFDGSSSFQINSPTVGKPAKNAKTKPAKKPPKKS